MVHALVYRILAVPAALAVAAPSAAQQAPASAPAPGSAPAPAGGGVAKQLEGDLGAAARALSGGGGLERLASVMGWLHQADSQAIQGARLAQRKSSSSTIRDLAAKVAGDHSAIESELGALAKARGIQLPGTGTPGGSGLAALGKLKGAAFDRSFLDWLATSQKRNAGQAAAARTDALKAGEPGLAAVLGKLVPKLQSHARSAERAQKLLPRRQARPAPASG